MKITIEVDGRTASVEQQGDSTFEEAHEMMAACAVAAGYHPLTVEDAMHEWELHKLLEGDKQ